VLILARWTRRSPTADPRRALLGIGVFAKNTNVLYAPALGLVFLLRKDWRGFVKIVVAAAVPGLLYAGMNWYFYGSPLATGYDRIQCARAASSRSTRTAPTSTSPGRTCGRPSSA
jgi:hypothetical protein